MKKEEDLLLINIKKEIQSNIMVLFGDIKDENKFKFLKKIFDAVKVEIVDMKFSILYDEPNVNYSSIGEIDIIGGVNDNDDKHFGILNTIYRISCELRYEMNDSISKEHGMFKYFSVIITYKEYEKGFSSIRNSLKSLHIT